MPLWKVLLICLSLFPLSLAGCSSQLSVEEARQQDTDDNSGDNADDGGGKSSSSSESSGC